MPNVNVVDNLGEKVRSVELNGVFGVKASRSLVHAAVVMQRASLRQGSASTKGRGEVSGSGRKPWKQKHTGRARAGSNRSPIWRHGGTVFGPKQRQYGFHMPKKMYRAALRSVLSAKCADGEVIVYAGGDLPEPKSKWLVKVLGQLQLTKKTMIVVGEQSLAWDRAGSNLQDVKVVHPQGLNVYHLLLYDVLLVLEDQVEVIQGLWA